MLPTVFEQHPPAFVVLDLMAMLKAMPPLCNMEWEGHFNGFFAAGFTLVATDVRRTCRILKSFYSTCTIRLMIREPFTVPGTTNPTRAARDVMTHQTTPYF